MSNTVVLDIYLRRVYSLRHDYSHHASGVLADQAWADRLTAEDRRGLTPLFWAHVAPYGEVRLDMGRRLSLHGAVPAAPPEAR